MFRRYDHVEGLAFIGVDERVGVDVFGVVAVEDHEFAERVVDVEVLSLHFPDEGGVDVSPFEFPGCHLHDVVGSERDVLRYAVDGYGFAHEADSGVCLHVRRLQSDRALDGLGVFHIHHDLVDFLSHAEFECSVLVFLHHFNVE